MNRKRVLAYLGSFLLAFGWDIAMVLSTGLVPHQSDWLKATGAGLLGMRLFHAAPPQPEKPE